VILLLLLFTGALGWVLWPIIIGLLEATGRLIGFPELLALISSL